MINLFCIDSNSSMGVGALPPPPPPSLPVEQDIPFLHMRSRQQQQENFPDNRMLCLNNSRLDDELYEQDTKMRATAQSAVQMNLQPAGATASLSRGQMQQLSSTAATMSVTSAPGLDCRGGMMNAPVSQVNL